ncbi:Rrp5p NDAI_0K00920 [Naumovozyma dairenensis CBS 421]|uniref:rRNA biogenesis protein RRP5 n=1 Tax=Naumovozyma dairenensis (strain ATCC 10597 / BCRC 20456 / CBS 421 / NBRC 0211 / NRRL Y-12639) TaxID=1071378 RepID=G0WHM2_NAUDC|nr:hypothetical protein NDAI_0K00920 [Naumovozyma dairenensis CBS 421]CCD27283.1 hypothetical protein NDAI_0K00920 [Naumovozyma dairenensis CBS 421]
MVPLTKRKRDEESPLTREDATKQPEASALIRNTEEVSFPRGGSSALTPLELKQVANEAANDVLFGKESEPTSNEASRPKKKKKISKKKSSSKTESGNDEEEEEKLNVVQHANFKTLKVGSLLLGQISSITKADLCVTFTDNISGYINLTHISEQFTSMLEELDEDMSSSDEQDTKNKEDNEEYDSSDDENSENKKPQTNKELPSLERYFKIGQWLRCCVITNSALEPKMKKKNSKRIELTIEPSRVNPFQEDDLLRSTAVQCSVKSIEDHGATLDLGIENMTGFISKKDCPDFETLLPGSVFLGNVFKKSDRSVQVNMDFTNKKNKITQISSVDAVVPGQSVDLLCQQITPRGINGKAFGLVPGFIGNAHLRVFKEEDLKHKFALGSNIQARIIAVLTNKENDKTLILSILPHILNLENKLKATESLSAFPIGYKFDSCDVKGRDSDYLYLALDDDRIGQVHSSRVGEQEGTDKLPARVLGFNSVDDVYELVTAPETLKLKYLRTKDIPVGELLTGCEIETVSSKGMKLKIFNGQFTATVPSLHISDTRLVYPERKFKIGSKVKARVLNVDEKGRVYVTLKKTLVNIEDDSDIQFISTYAQAKTIQEKSEKTVATVESFRPNGCIVSFFGGLTAFLPNAEISEVFVKRPEEHLRLGQTVIVKILKMDEEQSRMLVTCKISNDQAEQKKERIEKLIPGRSIVDVTVLEKTKESLIVELQDVDLRGVLYVGHLSDARIEQNRAAFKKIVVGSKLTGLVIDKDTRTQIFNLTLKKSLLKDAEKESSPLSYADLKSKDKTTPLHGYVKSISNKGIFVAFNGKFVGLVLPSYAVESRDIDISKVFYINQSVTAYLLRTDDDNQRFLLTLKEPTNKVTITTNSLETINPVDPSMKSLKDFTPGTLVKAQIKGIKKNQLNVILADNLHGRIDVAEVYDNLSEIKDTKQPLSGFKKGDIVKAKIIGTHDMKSHKFLPISHHAIKGTALELSLKTSVLGNPVVNMKSISDVSVGDELIGYVNNYTSKFLWLTISPILKAKISIFDLAKDGLKGSDIESNFPLGCALPVTVTSIDTEHGIINVKGKSHTVISIADIKVGDRLPARITKVTERYLLLDLGNGVSALSFATDALENFSLSLVASFKGKENKLVFVKVLSVDVESKKIHVSLKSDSAKSSSIKSHDDIKQGDIVDALVKNVSDKGIFVYLSGSIQAFVPVSKLSDSYLKEWKKFYKPMQHVIGKVVKSDEDDRILLTLRESEVNGDLNILKGYSDIKVNDVFDGTVKNVTDFGVFVKLDNTVNVTGLAHITEIADTQPKDLSSLFGTGDRVKAFVLKVNPTKKQLSLSLKASRFSKDSATKKDTAKEDMDEPVDVIDYNNESDVESDVDERPVVTKKTTVSTDDLSLSTGFDWTASILDQAQDEESEEDEDEDFTVSKKHKHSKKKQIVEDKTIDISTRAPESVADFERLIIGNPNSSVIWMNYMAFQLQLSEIEKARELAERALKTINFREEAEKQNIWIALLNLENTFGTEETLEDVFKRSCQYMDSFTMHNKLLSIYQMSEKSDKASELYKVTAKKFGSEKVSIWVSWGDFLISQGQTQEARSILANSLKALPKRSHIEVVRKFAQLEFAKGDPEGGRSLLEGLIADAPKRIDIWNVYIDQEIKIKEKKKVEELFERVLTKKVTRKQAKFFFNKWLQFEESQKDDKAVEYVKAKATEYVNSHAEEIEA